MLLQIRGTEWELYSTRDPGPNPLFIECSIHQSSCSDYHQILPTLKPNPAKWPPPPPPTIAFRYKVSIRDEPSPSPSSSSIELTSSGKGKKKNLVHEFVSSLPGSIEWLVSHEISHNCLSRNLEIGYFARPFFTRSTDYQSNRAGYRGDFSSF